MLVLRSFVPKRKKRSPGKSKPWLRKMKLLSFGDSTSIEYTKKYSDFLASIKPDSKYFGRPVKKKSRVGLSFLNNTGHRRNLFKSVKKQRRKR